jgi:hypothetical protein
MKVANQKMRWGVEKRMEFIEFRAFWEGGVNRSDLTEQFSISVPQASVDLSMYQNIAPGNLQYNASEKRYVPSSTFVPRMISPTAEEYLTQLISSADMDGTATWIASIPTVDVIPALRRRVVPEVLREMLRAIRMRSSVSVLYQSMNPRTPDLLWRTISPHALASDGMRWHVRAFCHQDLKFKDFLLSRCQKIGEHGDPGASHDMDSHWCEHFEVVLQANPLFSTSQREAVARDFEMTDGRLVLSVRRALLFYLNKHLRLDYVAFDSRPANNPLIVVNRDEFDEAIRAASF